MGYSLIQNDTELMTNWDEDLKGVDIETDKLAREYCKFVGEKLFFFIDESLRSFGYDHNNPEAAEFLKNNFYKEITLDGRLLFFLKHPEYGLIKIVWMQHLKPPLKGIEIKTLMNL